MSTLHIARARFSEPPDVVFISRLLRPKHYSKLWDFVNLALGYSLMQREYLLAMFWLSLPLYKDASSILTVKSWWIRANVGLFRISAGESYILPQPGAMHGFLSFFLSQYSRNTASSSLLSKYSHRYLFVAFLYRSECLTHTGVMLGPTFVKLKYFFYPIGNTPATNVLACRVVPSKGDAKEKGHVKILLLACGDPRSLLFTLWCKPNYGMDSRVHHLSIVANLRSQMPIFHGSLLAATLSCYHR